MDTDAMVYYIGDLKSTFFCSSVGGDCLPPGRSEVSNISQSVRQAQKIDVPVDLLRVTSFGNSSKYRCQPPKASLTCPQVTSSNHNQFH